VSTAEALREARAAGIQIKVDGNDLLLEAATPPSAAILDLLSENKTGILAVLRPGVDGWSPEDWQILFKERAAISEFHGAPSRAQAEEYAFACCVAEWLNRNPVSSMPGRCLRCGAGHHANDPLLPYGIETTGHAWLHSRCWPAWYEGRKAHAVAILSAMGITPAGRPLWQDVRTVGARIASWSGADVGRREPPRCR
jgi:hypothetical protein